MENKKMPRRITVTFSPEQTAKTNMINSFLLRKMQEPFEAFNRGDDTRMDKIFTEVYNFNLENKI